MRSKLLVVLVLVATAAVPASADAAPSQRSKDVKSCQKERRDVGKSAFRTKYRTLAGCLRARAGARGAKPTPAAPPVVPVADPPSGAANEITVVEEVTTTITTTTVSEGVAAAFPELPGKAKGKSHGQDRL